MASNTYVALATQTLSSAVSSVTFSSIPQGYTDLVIEATFLPSVSTSQPYIQFNTDTGTGTTNYSTTSVRGDGSSAASGRHTNIFGWYPVPGPGIGTNGNPEPWIVHIMNYSNTTTYKTGLSRFNNASSIVSANAHLWRATIQAINTITITMEAGNFNTGSTFTIYGIAAASVGAKATGGTIYSDSQYIYHAFASSGTFTPLQSLTADVLVVAGGGSGGNYYAGGGGAGGVCYQVGRSMTATGYTVTVGAGGAATGSGAAYDGNVGVNSTFDTITALGGGAGAGWNLTGKNGFSGGSGGGGSMGTATGNTTTGGAATQGNSGGATGYGNAGGGGYRGSGIFLGGGGGGAGAVGTTTNSSTIGTGGSGLNTWSTWASATGTGVSGYYAGGGGGSTEGLTQASGGAGGGGAGAIWPSQTYGNNAAINTGSGGGGAVAQDVSGNGGSGIVIVRYAR